MPMSDCPRCWDTPCTCGYQNKPVGNRGYSMEELDRKIACLDQQIKDLKLRIGLLEDAMRLNKG